MQDTLAHDWRRRMAGRSILVAMLLAVPLLIAALIGFSGGVGGLSFGIGSIATGPEDSTTSGAPQAAPPGLIGLGGVVGTVAGPGAAGAPAAGGGTGLTPSATGIGVTPPTVGPAPPSAGGTPPGTRQVGQTPPQASGGGTSVVPEVAAPEPAQVASDPLGSANETVNTVNNAVSDLLSPQR